MDTPIRTPGTGRRADGAAVAVDLPGVFGVTVGFLLDFMRSETVAAAATGDSAVAFADSDAEAAERGEVAGAPFPDAFIFAVCAADAAAAGLA